MRLASPALIAAVIPVVQSFLVPPSIPPLDDDITNTLPFGLETPANYRTLNLECPNCPVARFLPSGLQWVEGFKSKLLLRFSIEHNDVDILYLNGFQIYPPNVDQPPLDALQISAYSDSATTAGFLRLGYELGITPVVRLQEEKLELISVHLQIVEISDKFVDGLDGVELKLLKTTSGKLVIGDLETVPTNNPGGDGCISFACKLRNILSKELSRCGTKAGHHGALSASGHHQHGSASGHNHHHKHHGFAQFLHGLKSVALHVLIPVLLGVSVGFTASFVGMLAGQAVIFIWRVFYRRHQRSGYSHVHHDKNLSKDKDQDQADLMVGQPEKPPVYDNNAAQGKSEE